MRNAECGITRLRRENSECGMRNAELRACGGKIRNAECGMRNYAPAGAADAAGRFDATRGLRESCNFGGENCKYSLQNARENCKEQI